MNLKTSINGNLWKRIALRAEVRGTFHNLATGDGAVEIACSMGFDFVVFDDEHGLRDACTVRNAIRAAALFRTPALVRVSEGSRSIVGRTLDSGASGIIVPHVEDPEEIRRTIQYAQYAPSGKRGWDWPAPWLHHAGLDPEHTGVIAMIESRRGLEAVHEIASVEGVKAILPGRGDLAKEMGLNRDDTRVTTAIERIAEAVRLTPAGPALMLLCRGTDQRELAEARALGASCLMIGPDSLLLREALARVKNTLEADNLGPGVLPSNYLKEEAGRTC